MKKLVVLLAIALIFLASCGGGAEVGSGGTGLTAGGGVGSGGTGSPAVSIGPITGFGSIFVNGIEYDISAANIALEDATDLKLGMTVEVQGTVNADFTRGTASAVLSAADMRGLAFNINLAAGTFDVLGTTVSTDPATVFDGVASLATLLAGETVQIYGLVISPGNVLATRVEKPAASSLPVLSGSIVNLAPLSNTFGLGNLMVNYTGATFTAGLLPSQLANGLQVRVRAQTLPVAGVLQATNIQMLHSSQTTSAAVSLAGVVTNFVSLGSFKVLEAPVDASAAQITGGPGSSIGNGVKIEVSGSLRNGVVVASKLKITRVPGTGGTVSFSLSGPIAAFSSSANFKVKGNPVNASGSSVKFGGASVLDLRNGVKVFIVGSQVIDGFLQADSVTFIP